MDYLDRDWAAELTDAQEEQEKDVDLGPTHLEKMISKKQEEGFLPQKILGVNRRRKDSGTKATESRQHEYKRDDTKLEAEFKKKRERVFEKQEMELESMPEHREEDVEDQVEYWENEYGMDEFHHLSRNGVAQINEKTEFSDGWRADGSYTDGYWREPTAEELRQIEAEEQWGREQARKISEFNESKPVKPGSQKVRKIL